jgi:hypothetical protein
MSDRLVTWAGTAFAGSITVFAIGVFVEVPFLQPVRGSAAPWRAWGSPGRPEPRIVPEMRWPRTG